MGESALSQQHLPTLVELGRWEEKNISSPALELSSVF